MLRLSKIIFLSGILIVLDRVTKQLSIIYSVEFINYNFLNPYLAFLVFLLFSLVMFFVSKKHFFERWFVSGFSLIVIGFFSNLYDKVVYNGVIDYLYLPFGVVFNLSDVYIILGFFGIIRGLTKQGI